MVTGHATAALCGPHHATRPTMRSSAGTSIDPVHARPEPGPMTAAWGCCQSAAAPRRTADPQRRVPRACGPRRGRTMWRATRRRARVGTARQGPARGLPRGMVAVERSERPATSPPPGLGNHAGDVPCRAPGGSSTGRTHRPPPAGAGSVVNRCGGGWSAVADAPSTPPAEEPPASKVLRFTVHSRSPKKRVAKKAASGLR